VKKGIKPKVASSSAWENSSEEDIEMNGPDIIVEHEMIGMMVTVEVDTWEHADYARRDGKRLCAFCNLL